MLAGGHSRASVPPSPGSQGSQWAEHVALVLPPPWTPDHSLQKHVSCSPVAVCYWCVCRMQAPQTRPLAVSSAPLPSP